MNWCLLNFQVVVLFARISSRVKGWESRKDSWQRNEDEAEEILGVT
jgi:hypothetical protein